MNILIVNTSELIGGAAAAANRLMKALQKEAVNAEMLVLDKQTEDTHVHSLNNSWFMKKINRFRFLYERLIIFCLNKFDKVDLFKTSIANTGTDIRNHPLVINADIIHIHWINHNFLSLKNIEQLTNLGKPIVWTMHDMWPFTGICHHARECMNYQNECGQCFYLHSSNPKDISHRIFSRKKKILQHKNVSFVGCSRWMAERAKLSALTGTEKITSIPNPIDTDVFRKTNKEKARKDLNLPQDKYLLLFGAVNVNDKRKGLAYLIDGFKYMKQQFPAIYDKIELVIFGRIKSDIHSFFDIPIHSLNFLKDEETIVNLYNAVDLFVTPSLDENLPNTIMEAMACGTPCVGFNTGGIPEMIDHKKNGYVAQYRDVEDLAKGIQWVLNNPESEKLPESCRHKVLEKYAEKVAANQYVELYEKLLF
jgi:glycosyltransferase involved in cell wall biosynthesis